MTTVLIMWLCLASVDDACQERQVWMAGSWTGEDSAQLCEAEKAKLQEKMLDPGMELTCETAKVAL